MSVWGSIAAVIATPLVLAAAWSGAKYAPTLFFPTKPQLFKFKRTSAHNSGNGAAVDSKDGPVSTSIGGVIANGVDDALKTELLSVQTLLETRVPSLFSGYAPSWWLPSGHMLTGYVVAGDFTKVDQVVYERALIRLPDGGTLAVDMAPRSEEAADLPADAPILVVQHGLTGGSYEPYVRSILAGATAPKSKGGLGMRAFVVNFRGCANVPFTSPMIYSARNTDDLRSGLLYITSQFPTAPLHGIGFSLGANILTRYFGEEGSKSKLRSGLVLACPWDLTANSARLEGHFLNRNIYSKAMGMNLLTMFKMHVAEFQALPEDERMTPLIPKALALKWPTLKDFDHNITARVGGRNAPFPFESADDYYLNASSHGALVDIRVPFLAINAADDPIVAVTPNEEVRNSISCALAVTKYGGHLGWFQGGSPIGSGPPPDRWVRKPALEWLRACAEDYVPDDGMGSPSIGEDRYEHDGFVLEKGKNGVGYKVLEAGIVFEGMGPVRNILAGL